VVGWDIIRSMGYLGRVSLAEGNETNAREIFMKTLLIFLPHSDFKISV
jgi:hypothetical protein